MDLFVYVFQSAVGSGVRETFAVGQGVNSHFGPVLPTEEPSGQIFASIVHAFCLSTFLARNSAETAPVIAIAASITMKKIDSLNLGAAPEWLCPGGVCFGEGSTGGTGGVFGWFKF